VDIKYAVQLLIGFGELVSRSFGGGEMMLKQMGFFRPHMAIPNTRATKV
jgi:hypothetical protein